MRIARRTASAAGVLAGLVTTLAGAQARQSSGAIVLPSDADIRKMLAERVDALAAQERSVGIVIGVTGPQGRRVISYGHLSQGDPRPLDGDTGFEIGSVTKVFTALLLADMVRKGEVALADPVAKYPPTARIPERSGRSITLLDLATHISGLPFMPDALPAFNDSAATKYGAAQLYQFLARRALPRNIDAKWEYSNIGYWLLGQALPSRAAMDGGTLGYASAVAWDPKKRVGVVVLSNQVAGVSDIARHLLRPNVPLERPTATKRTEIALDSAVLDAYTGRYERGARGYSSSSGRGTS